MNLFGSKQKDKDVDVPDGSEFKTRMLILEATRLAEQLHASLMELTKLQGE